MIGLSSQRRFFQGERYNVTLGGGRSILLSYWCIHFYILPKFFPAVKKIRHIFYALWHILSGSLLLKGETDMRECSDPRMDLDDLIFDADAGGPSER